MKEFELDQILLRGGIHAVFKIGCGLHGGCTVNQEEKDKWLELNEAAETLSRRLGFKFSELATQRIKEALSQETTPLYDYVMRLEDELDHRLLDEMKSRRFYCIEPDKMEFVDGKNLFGQEVTGAFPSTIIDIEEAGKCLAFERWTAVVFHLMRVMESGLRVLGRSLNLPATTNRNWETVLQRCDKELGKPNSQRSPEWALDDAFYSEASTMLRSVKDAWRNPTMHIGQVYTQAQAEDVWNSVRAFMRKLATKLKESNP